MELFKGISIQRNIAEVANESRVVVFSNFLEGQRPVLVSTVGHRIFHFGIKFGILFCTCCVSSWRFYKDLCFVKHSELICDITGKRSIRAALQDLMCNCPQTDSATDQLGTQTNSSFLFEVLTISLFCEEIPSTK